MGSSIGAMIAPAAGGVGYRDAQLAAGVHYLRRAELRMGNGVVDFFYKHPRDQKKPPKKNANIHYWRSEAQHQVNNGKKLSVSRSAPAALYAVLPRFSLSSAWGTFNAWIPLFMFKVYGFNLKEIAMFGLDADAVRRSGLYRGWLPAWLFQRWFGEPDCSRK